MVPPSFSPLLRSSRRSASRAGFTLTELLVVLAIIGALTALLFPVLGAVRAKGRVTKSTANLRQIGLGVQMYAADNNGYVPCVRGPENVSAQWDPDPHGARWSQDLNTYVGGKAEASYWDLVPTGKMSQVFNEPVYASIVPRDPNNAYSGNGGWSWNARINLVRGETFSQWNPNSSMVKRYKLANIRSDSALVMMGRYEGFSPNNDGTLPDEPFGGTSSTPVPHSRRIGADKNGLNGRSALYLFADGSVKELTPDQSKEYLRLRDPL